MNNLWMYLLISWAAGAVASFAELFGMRWHYNNWAERLVLALVWPLTVLLMLYTIAALIVTHIRGR